MGDRGSIEGRNVTGIDNVIPGFTIRNSQDVQIGNVSQTIAAALGQGYTLEQGPRSLLASRIAKPEGQGPRPEAHIVPAASQENLGVPGPGSGLAPGVAAQARPRPAALAVVRGQRSGGSMPAAGLGQRAIALGSAMPELAAMPRLDVPQEIIAENAATQGGVQLTTGMYLQCLNDGAQETLKAKAAERMQQIRSSNQVSDISAKAIFSSEGGFIPMDRRFAEACAASAARGSVFIMRGVNKDSLGENGVLLSPDIRAPKPMTCHAKSSEFGFTKGLVPANPQFSRPAYVNKDGDKYKGAFKDVNKTLGRNEEDTTSIAAGVGTDEGRTLHLKIKIQVEGQDEIQCHVYQGTFQKNGITYRYQVALPADTQANATQQAIQNKLQDREHLGSYLKVYKDPNPGDDVLNWEEVADLGTIQFSEEDFTQMEPTLVIGLAGVGQGQVTERMKRDKGSQHIEQDRYYVSDYDVYAVAHTSTVITGQNPRIEGWGNHGEFADPRDIKAIIAVNRQLLDPNQHIESFEEKLGSHFRDFPIQHAPCAATQVKGGGDAPLSGYAVPDFMENPPKSLWAIEGERIIELKDAEDFAAYMITKACDVEQKFEAILNSKVLDHCMNKLYQVQPRAAA